MVDHDGVRKELSEGSAFGPEMIRGPEGTGGSPRVGVDWLPSLGSIEGNELVLWWWRVGLELALDEVDPVVEVAVRGVYAGMVSVLGTVEWYDGASDTARFPC
jgi:hypothetical protein